MFRFATTDDLKAISRLRYKMFDEIGNAHLLVDDFLDKTVAYYTEQYRLGKCLHFVKEENGVIVACAGGIIRRDPFTQQFFKRCEYGYVMDVYVEPSHRRQGIARTLTEKIVDWLRTQDVVLATLHASRFAGTLYQSLGFASSIEMSLDLRADRKTS